MGKMEIHDLNSWDEFRPLVKEIRAKYGHLRLTEDYITKNVVLFRGHGQADWPLRTTLERCSEECFSVERYMHHAYRCANELESFTGKRWNIPPWPEIEEVIKKRQDTFKVHLPSYDYLVYLRHHGFPSPLLDWTESPYIAAYFAYCEKQNAERVAVYAYIERPTGIKGGTGGAPQITLMGPYVSTHARHFCQKAWYTIASKYDCKEESHNFYPHDDALKETFSTQDIVIKITIPSEERLKALHELSDYNINAFTLFQTEDALVKALSIKELELNDT